jgi:hypothetical protein
MSTSTSLKNEQSELPTLFRMAPTSDLPAQAIADVRTCA